MIFELSPQLSADHAEAAGSSGARRWIGRQFERRAESGAPVTDTFRNGWPLATIGRRSVRMRMQGEGH